MSEIKALLARIRELETELDNAQFDLDKSKERVAKLAETNRNLNRKIKARKESLK